MTAIDEYSLSTVPIQQFFNETSLGNATAFVWFEHGNHYLITNWHAVAMIDPNTGANLHTKAARPDTLRAQFNSCRAIWEKLERDIPLRDDAGRPVWLVHPAHKRKVDVVAIPLPPPDPELNYYPINRMTREEDLSIQISMDVYVLGYPFGAPAPGFPVWKRGSIASEPQLARIGHQYFLIDTASRPGMSGAPVILRSWGTRILEHGGATVTPGSATRFIGIYSGRLHTKDYLEVQLGMVWPASFIGEIIAGGKIDE